MEKAVTRRDKKVAQTWTTRFCWRPVKARLELGPDKIDATCARAAEGFSAHCETYHPYIT